MIGIILVSHSQKLAEGLKEIINEMIGGSPNVVVHSAGGTGDGRLGTNPLAIIEKINRCIDCHHILIFCDIGSAILSAETAKDLIEGVATQEKIVIVDAPLVEGALVASIQASVTSDLAEISREVILLNNESVSF